jgi:hypothetical protein
MEIYPHRIKHIRRKLSALLTIAALALAGTGCENYGKLQRDSELTRAFENHTLPRDYTYYYYGRENMPYAVMGVGFEYTLESELWQTVDLQSDRFKNMVKWIWTDHNYAPYGAYILGPEGERIGIWYASISHAAINVNAAQKTVGVIPDKPFLRDGPSK